MTVNELYNEYHDYTLNVALLFCKNVEDAEDISHSVWFSIINNNSVVKSPKTYLYSAVKNNFLNFKRRHSRLVFKEFDIIIDEDPFLIVQTREEFEKFIDCLMMLPVTQRKVCYKRLVEQKTFKEIAKEMGTPYDTCKANYRHGVLKLRKELR